MNFAEDKLDRRELVDNLFKIFDHFSNRDGHGFTMAINGKYGSGKTTLLDFIKEDNERRNGVEGEVSFDIIEYNAWKDNLFANPLIPILNQVLKLNNTKNTFKKIAGNLLKKAAKIGLSTLSNITKVDATAILDENVDIFTEYNEYNKALTDLHKELAKYCEDKKVVLLVDELDRCLPEYQIKVLETLYHVLDVPNLVVVIALDVAQLECSVRNMFGETNNTVGYLSKFINYQIDLPVGTIDNLYVSLMDLKCEYEVEIKPKISRMIIASGLSCREGIKLINELNLLCCECNRGTNNLNWKYFVPLIYAFLLIIKYTNMDLYNKYFTYKNKEQHQSKQMKLQDSKFGEFIKDVKNTSINAVLDYMIHARSYSTTALLEIINLFCHVDDIEVSTLSEYVSINQDRVQKVVDNICFNQWNYPDNINHIISEMEIFKF